MNYLGSIGRLGNQMFQYASLRSLAKKFNYQYVLPEQKDKMYGEDLTLFDCFKLDNEQRLNTNLYEIKLENLGFEENIFTKCPDNVDLIGYFQDIRYFENNLDDIKECFEFKDDIFNMSKNIFYSAFLNEEVISLHIRRTDYLNYPEAFPVVPIEYYSHALDFFDENIKVLIFSDDIEWAQNQDIFKSDRFFFSTNNSNAVDLCLQTMCHYHIIANSTFSWWGAMLSNSKKVIKPSRWFGCDPKLSSYVDFLNVAHWTNLNVW